MIRTIVVITVNYANQGLDNLNIMHHLAPYEKLKSLGSRGSMVTRLKLKGIDRRAPLGVKPVA
jgi:hypothetical protein